MIDTRQILALAIAAGAYQDRPFGEPLNWGVDNNKVKPPRKARKDRTQIKNSP